MAVSNSIMWLANIKTDQAELIKKLASNNYMNTSLKNGTGTSGMLNGIDKIAQELFQNYSKLEYQGWRKHPAQFSTNQKKPELPWIKKGVTKNSAVWLNIGWYKYNANTNNYTRIGGHWVTVVGYTDKQLVLHDPSPRAGKHFANEYVQVERIMSGNLTGKKSGLPTTAKGYYKLGAGMHIKKSADYAIIDGVIRLSL